MSSSVFDGSTTGGIATPPIVDNPSQTVPYDALDALRDQIREREAEDNEQRTTTVPIADTGWRLVCGVDFTYSQYIEWQKASLPPNQRKGRNLNPFDLDQVVLAQLVLTNTCEGLEFQTSTGEWELMTDADGTPVTLLSHTLLSRFNVVDPRTLISMLFGRPARTIAAGRRVIDASGFGESGDDDPLG